MTAVRVLENRYVDSVVLMRLAQALGTRPGIDDAAALMATAANRALLQEGGFLVEPLSAGADDLVVAVKAGSDADAADALSHLEELLEAPPRAAALRSVRTLEEAIALQPASDVAVITIPGESAGAEARRALERGLHVFLFSSNVPLQEELDLKALAAERGLLCMGPDCGTALISGIGLGFANVVRRGPVGIVGASGTGIQAVSSLLDGFGIGISHAIGCGSRDLSREVGGATAAAGLEALLADEATEVVVVLSKPAASEVIARLRQRADGAAKPVVFGILGAPGGPATFDEIAREAAAALGAVPPPAAAVPDLGARLAETQRFVRGLFAGGTLAYEAQLVLSSAGLTLSSNAPLPGAVRIAGSDRSAGHVILDLGSEEFTHGRPHPMIDSRARRARLHEEAEDPTVAVLLLDVVLGHGAAADPAGDIAPAIVQARTIAAAAGRELVVLAHVCGTEADPQDLVRQQQTLRAAGATVFPTSAAAATAAAALVTRGGTR